MDEFMQEEKDIDELDVVLQGHEFKSVSRLNLRFEEEDASMFHQRRQLANEGRENVITSLRFDRMLTSRDIPPVKREKCERVSNKPPIL